MSDKQTVTTNPIGFIIAISILGTNAVSHDLVLLPQWFWIATTIPSFCWCIYAYLKEANL